MKINYISGDVDKIGNLQIHISLGGVSGASHIVDGIESLNAIMAGQLLDGSLGFVMLATKIYTAIKRGK